MRTSSLGKPLTIVVLAAAVAGGLVTPAASAATPITKAQARAIAKHINVRQSDFPGYTEHPYTPSKSANELARKSAKCAGMPPTFAKVTSAAYDDGHGAAYNSETEFVATRAAARHDATRATSARTRQCSEKALADAAKGAGVSEAQVTFKPVPETSVKGIDVIFGMKITMTFTAYGIHGTLHGWAIGFSRGNAEVTLSEVGTAKLPQSALNASLAKLIARAKHQVPARGLPVSRG